MIDVPVVIVKLLITVLYPGQPRRSWHEGPNCKYLMCLMEHQCKDKADIQ